MLFYAASVTKVIHSQRSIHNLGWMLVMSEMPSFEWYSYCSGVKRFTVPLWNFWWLNFHFCPPNLVRMIWPHAHDPTDPLLLFSLTLPLDSMANYKSRTIVRRHLIFEYDNISIVRSSALGEFQCRAQNNSIFAGNLKTLFPPCVEIPTITPYVQFSWLVILLKSQSFLLQPIIRAILDYCNVDLQLKRFPVAVPLNWLGVSNWSNISE